MNQELINKIDSIRHHQNCIIIVIEGMAGSGKSTLGEFLSNYYQTNLIHMDDFFLPLEKRTPERLSEVGGNIDYERFKNEVVDHLNTDFYYGVFNCSKGEITTRKQIKRKPMLIIEGSYAMHPYFGKYYDLSIFLEVSSEAQVQRILKRNGEFLFDKFINNWIPMENRYFKELSIRDKADIIIDKTLDKDVEI